MPISEQQICMLQEGDVVSVPLAEGGRCFAAILERNGSKLVLSMIVSNIKCLQPIRNTQWEYLIVDESGRISDKGCHDLTDEFLKGEIHLGRAMDVVHKYRSRIMPNMKLLRDGNVFFDLGHERARDIQRNILRIQEMIFNDDYNTDGALMADMFARIIKGTPHQELPIYVCKMMDTLNSFASIKMSVGIQSAIMDIFGPEEEISAGDEVQDVIRKASSGKSS